MGRNTDLRERLEQLLSRFDSLAVAFSGGVDSSVLLKAAHSSMAGKGKKVLAVSVSTPYTHSSETAHARRIAEEIGAPLDILALSPDPVLYNNPRNRCYLCKKQLFSEIIAHSRGKGFTTVAEGSLYDDQFEHRPGLKALEELGVESPLKEYGLKKSDVRALAREYGLSNHDQPSYTCLLTRFPIEWKISREDLEKVGRAETLLREAGFAQVRFRHHGNIGRIEVDPGQMSLMLNEEIRKRVNSGIKELGYDFVSLDLEGYRFGSME